MYAVLSLLKHSAGSPSKSARKPIVSSVQQVFSAPLQLCPCADARLLMQTSCMLGGGAASPAKFVFMSFKLTGPMRSVQLYDRLYCGQSNYQPLCKRLGPCVSLAVGIQGKGDRALMASLQL